jgi:hypothetical protein
MSSYFKTATDLFAAPLAPFRRLLKITSLSFVYRATALMPYIPLIRVFLDLSTVIAKTNPQLG